MATSNGRTLEVDHRTLDGQELGACACMRVEVLAAPDVVAAHDAVVDHRRQPGLFMLWTAEQLHSFVELSTLDETLSSTTALRGAGGFGKTTLALALCWDARIAERCRAALKDLLGSAVVDVRRRQ